MLGERASEVQWIAVSSSKKHIAASRSNQLIEVYDLDTQALTQTISTSTICSELKFLGNDRFLIAGGNDGKVRIF